MKKIYYGLKVWSHNSAYMPLIGDLVKRGVCDFVEVYVNWKTSDEYIPAWKDVNVPLRLHAPHSHGGFNPSVKEGMEQKLEILRKVDAYRKAFDPKSIVFHPGINGNITETVTQYIFFQQQFPELFKAVLIENKPKLGIKDELCCGATPEEIKMVMNAAGFRFCLDFGHAICYAAWAKLPWEKVVDSFMELSPSLYHISDSDTASMVDDHRHFGDGNFDLQSLVGRIPDGAYVTIETKHDHPDRLDDFERDVDQLKGLAANADR